MPYIVRIVRGGGGGWSNYWPGKNILVFTVRNRDFFIYLNNVDKTLCY